ncbi:hypothetical protein FLW16_28900 [Microbispora sp. KK1-11]|nr:hypothetical protein FLW16_28900 [Microbispora sp. KK1-11]
MPALVARRRARRDAVEVRARRGAPRCRPSLRCPSPCCQV